MRRVSVSPRVQIIRESTEVDRPRYGGLFRKEMACQTSETKVKEFQTVLKQLDTIKTDLSQTSTVIRMDCEIKLKSKAEELKKEYEKKVVDLQRSYSHELEAIKHVFNTKLRNSIITLDANYKKLVKKYVPQGETIYFGSTVPSEDSNSDSYLGSASKGSNDNLLSDGSKVPLESNNMVLQSEIVKLRAENRLLMAKLKAIAKAPSSTNVIAGSNPALNEGIHRPSPSVNHITISESHGTNGSRAGSRRASVELNGTINGPGHGDSSSSHQKQPGNLLTISESQGNNGTSRATSRRASAVSSAVSLAESNGGSNNVESSNSLLHDTNKDTLLIQKLLQEVQSKDEEIKKLQRQIGGGTRSSIAGFRQEDHGFHAKPNSVSKQRASIASVSHITETIGSEFKADLSNFANNLNVNLEKLGKRVSDASEISSFDQGPKNRAIEGSQDLSDIGSSKDQLEPSFDGANVVDFAGFNFTQTIAQPFNPPPPKPGSLVRRSSLLENSRRLSSAIQADIDAINGVKTTTSTRPSISMSNGPNASTSARSSMVSNGNNNNSRNSVTTGNAVEVMGSDHPLGSIQRRSSLVGISLLSAAHDQANFDIIASSNQQQQQPPSLVRRQSVDNGRSSITSSPTGHTGGVNFNLPLNDGATGNTPSPKLQRRPTIDQGIMKRRQSMSVAKGPTNYDVQCMVQERAQELISEQVKSFSSVKNRYVNKIEDLRELIGRYDTKLQESKALKQEMKEMLQQKDRIISDLEKKLEVSMAEYQRRLKRIKVNCTDSVQKVSRNLRKEIKIYRTRFEMMRQGLKKCSHTDPAFRDIIERQSELVKLINMGALNALIDGEITGDGDMGTGESNFEVYDETGAEFQEEEETTPSSEISTSRSEDDEDTSNESLNAVSKSRNVDDNVGDSGDTLDDGQ